MKKILLNLIVSILFIKATMGQVIPGVKQIAPIKSGISFIHRDVNNRLWFGYGAMPLYGNRFSNGLHFLDSSLTFKTKYSNGSFTDAINWNDKTYITAIDGLYQLEKDTFLQTPTMYNSTCISSFKDSLVVGSIGYGLYFWKNNHFKIQRIKIQNRYLDTIYDVIDNGNELWIATNSGLVYYKEGKFTLVKIPILSNTFLQKQNKILSLAKDKNGIIWFSNASDIDSVSNLFYIKNNIVVDANKEFIQNCYRSYHIPKYISKLNTARNGTILIGSYYGMVEVSDGIKQFITAKILNNQNYFDFKLGITIKPNYAFEDIDGTYICINDVSASVIDRRIYTLEKYREISLGKYPMFDAKFDINDISANVANDGVFFNGDDMNRSVSVRKVLGLRSLNNCNDLMYQTAQWLSAESTKDSIRKISIALYRSNTFVEYAPGPINTQTLAFDSSMVVMYNKIWVVFKKEIDEFNAKRLQLDYVIPKSILEWPGNAPSNSHSELAPFVDIDTNGKYEPLKGDYPKIKGDVMFWWVFNDIVPHKYSGSEPLKIQINASCYAYNDLRMDESNPDFIVNRILLFDLKYINLSGYDYNDFNIAYFNDIDLGDYSDDAVGCDSSINLGFGYNSKNSDAVFGNNPPIVACKFLNRPMNHFVANRNGFYFPNNALGYFSLSRSIEYSGNGIFNKLPNFQYNEYPCQSPPPQGLNDMRFLMSTDVGDLKNNSSVNLEMAYFVQYNPNVDYLKDNCNELKNNANKIQNWYDNNSFPSKSYWSTELTEIILPKIEVYPNPSNAIFSIEANADISKIKVYDVLGNLVIEQNCSQNQATINLEKLDKGIYILHAVTAYGVATKKLIKS